MRELEAWQEDEARKELEEWKALRELSVANSRDLQHGESSIFARREGASPLQHLLVHLCCRLPEFHCFSERSALLLASSVETESATDSVVRLAACCCLESSTGIFWALTCLLYTVASVSTGFSVLLPVLMHKVHGECHDARCEFWTCRRPPTVVVGVSWYDRTTFGKSLNVIAHISVSTRHISTMKIATDKAPHSLPLLLLLALVGALNTQLCRSLSLVPIKSSREKAYRQRNPIAVRLNMSTSNLRSAPIDELTDDLLQQVLAVAVQASKEAGEIILGNAGGAEITKAKANSRDLLTLIDPLCEKTIRQTIHATFPDHKFLGEEDVDPGKEASAAALYSKLTSEGSDWLWIVDPIDGTTNFVHGMPLCMPSVAACYKGQVVCGVIYDCHRDELFTATKGQGAFMNGVSIQVGQQQVLGDAIVAMGSPPGEESMQMSIKGVAALMPKVRTIRMLGSAAIMLAWVANGRLTCYWEYDLSSWDIAAGALLVTEAGGRFTDLEGHDFDLSARKICASNKAVHEQVLETLHSAGIH
jgi:myo-inositol-1(or 4)-monophosphatase